MDERRAERKVGHSAWWWAGVTALVAVGVLGVIAIIMVRRASPILKGRVIETLSTRFQSKVELDGFSVGLGRGIEVSGDGLRIYPVDAVMEAGETKPLIEIRHFAFHSGISGLFIKPMHVGTVHVTGLSINIPPREYRQAAPKKEKVKSKGKMKIVVDEIVCDDSHLIVGTLKPGKDPKDFVLRQIVLHEVGPEEPWRYEATIVNAIPVGDVHANGTFGPWVTESPGDSNVTGHYTFENVNMDTIKGLDGTLTSTGDFDGQVNQIHVKGQTETPNFSIDTANHPMRLHTEFDARVDGTTGDTYLDHVEARLGAGTFGSKGAGSDMFAKGAIVNVKGKGHIIDVAVDVPGGRIQDFLELGVKTQPAIMTGNVAMKVALHIPPGKISVSQKMGLKGGFTMRAVRFSNEKVQDKVDMLSLRAQGDPKEAKPGAEDVTSQIKGQFVMGGGKFVFTNLAYALPGANVHLDGVYSLDGNEFDFHGKVRTEAKVSQMVASRWKSWLLKPVDPFFKGKDGQGGAEIPVKITGTKSEPKFGLDLGRKKGS
ncbi:hypothetical protein BH10ACI4_BH10ACI4_29230 [soil metagenome]